MVLFAVIAVSLVVVFGMLKLADKAFRDPKPKVDLHYDPLAVDTDVNIPPGVTGEARDRMHEALTKQDLRYNPLSTDEDICMPVRPPSKCLVCGDPMKREQGVETCDCPQRGYQPRS